MSIGARHYLPIEVAALPPVLDRYAYVRVLGRGGMAYVEEVRDGALRRRVARKISIDDPLNLVREAQLCGQLEHPAISPLYDVGVDELGNAFYTMPVIRGQTLRAVLADRRGRAKDARTLAQVLGVVRQVCLAVDYAHSRGVVHRDIKPANVLLGKFGEVYVLDWGVAYVLPTSDIERGPGSIGEREVIGTPGYRSPEQIVGASIEPRTDVFALGVMLYEALTGILPYRPSELEALGDGLSSPMLPPPHEREKLGMPKALDDVVVSCLAIKPHARIASARRIADEIEAYLDRARDRAERLRDADILADEGEQSQMVHDVLAYEASQLQREADEILDRLPSWAGVEQKQVAWDIEENARLLAAEAARALARAETAFTQAVGRASDHEGARKGLTVLSYRQFVLAEEAGDTARMARHIDVARAYDDGTLALELADEVELVVETSKPGLRTSVSRYEESGWLLRSSPPHLIETTPTPRARIRSGSYVVSVEAPGGEIRYPVLLRRTSSFRLFIRVPEKGELPPGMVFIPGGPFLARRDARGEKRTSETLMDFAIGRFPVTLREYCRFLEGLDETERARRLPRSFLSDGSTFALVARDAGGEWHADPRVIEGPARARVVSERDLDIPVYGICWYDALAYTRWLAMTTDRPYRLPTDLEWEKAARGADGRLFPMGSMLDPAFAKRRESRPESCQPEPVGQFELDQSPYGVCDLAGGIGDLTSTSADGAALPGLEAEGLAEADERQVLWRGGNWGSTVATRHAMRYTQPLRERTTLVGFRLALSLCVGETSSLSFEPMVRQPSSTAT